MSAMRPSLWITKRKCVRPMAPTWLFQFLRISVDIVVRYSGQQKSVTSRFPPAPPPPDERPKPIPLAGFFAIEEPSCTSLPTVGLALFGSFASTLFGVTFFGGALVG